MKGLRVLKKRWLLSNLLVSSLLSAEGGSLLSTLKEEQFGYDYQKNDLQNNRLRDSWIAPVQLQYSYGKSNQYNGDSTTQRAFVSINQPIFQSGGIYYGIKFAEASRRYANLSVDAARQRLIKEAVSLLMQIRRSDRMIEKQKLQIDNASLNLEFKTESFLHGELDSGFLDNAIIDKNNQSLALIDLETARERLISSFQSISDADYQSAALPELSLMDEERFAAEAIDLKLSRSEIEKNRWNQNVTRAKYLPQISLNGAYNWEKLVDPAFAGTIMHLNAQSNYVTYGATASMKLDFNEWRDMESARIETLKSGVALADKKRELDSLYRQVRQNLSKIERKIALAEENRQLYEKLREDTDTLYKAGYKTEYDVRILANSAKIQRIEGEILHFDEQLELLNLYEKVYGAF